jgi:hypothetical protein
MTTNPILEEIRRTREKMLAESGGTLEGLVSRLQKAERESGRTVYKPPRTTPNKSQPLISSPGSETSLADSPSMTDK